MSQEFGIRPADIDDMTLREVDEYLTQLAELRQQQEATSGAG